MILRYCPNDEHGQFKPTNNQYTLTECISAVETEQLNGDWYIEIKYLATDSHGIADLLTVGSRITRSRNPDRRPNKSSNAEENTQNFIITRATRTYENGIEVVNIFAQAEFIYYAGCEFVEDINCVDLTRAQALQKILLESSRTLNTGFTFKFTSEALENSSNAIKNLRLVRKSVWDCINGDKDNALINRYGGEYFIDGLKIYIADQIGDDNGQVVTYAKNITGASADLTIENLCTCIMPEGTNGLLLPEKYINSSNHGQNILEDNDGNRFINIPAEINSHRLISKKVTSGNTTTTYYYTAADGTTLFFYNTFATGIVLTNYNNQGADLKVTDGTGANYGTIPAARVRYIPDLTRYVTQESLSRIQKINFNIGIVEPQTDESGKITNADEIVTEEEAYELLREAAQQKFSSEHIDEPQFNLDLDIIELADCLTWEGNDYKQILESQRMHLGDTIKVYLKSFGVYGTARVQEIQTDIATGRVNKISVGNFKRTFIKDLKKSITDTQEILTSAIVENKAHAEQEIKAAKADIAKNDAYLEDTFYYLGNLYGLAKAAGVVNFSFTTVQPSSGKHYASWEKGIKKWNQDNPDHQVNY